MIGKTLRIWRENTILEAVRFLYRLSPRNSGFIEITYKFCSEVGIEIGPLPYLEVYHAHFFHRDKTIRDSVIHDGHYSLHIAQRALNLVDESDLSQFTLVNVGANVGTTALNFHSLGCRRFALVEPHPDTFELLTRNCQQLTESGSDVTLVNKGIAQTAGIGQLSICERNPGANSLRMQRSDVTVDVQLQPLDDALDFSKIAGERAILLVDTEGFEVEVLKSCSHLDLFELIIIELSSDSYAVDERAFLADLFEASPQLIDCEKPNRPRAQIMTMLRTGSETQMDIAFSVPSPNR